MSPQWQFGSVQPALRGALQDLPRYIVTVETAKHRFFQFQSSAILAEHSVVCIALDNAFSLGVLSSTIHVTWALAAGGRMGIGNDPRYQKAMTFDPFPFPDPNHGQRGAIAEVAEALDRHRKEAIARDERVTVTGMYNVIEKLRSGMALTAKEREVHEIAACGVLRDLHDTLDRLVAEAYGWPWPLGREEILDRIVALHDQRILEERQGKVRWLRPEYQIPRFAPEGTQQDTPVAAHAPGDPEADLPVWPATVIEQIASLKRLVDGHTVTTQEAANRFRGARRDLVERHLETLALMGEVQRSADGHYRAWSTAA